MPTCPICGADRETLSGPCEFCGSVAQEPVQETPVANTQPQPQVQQQPMNNAGAAFGGVSADDLIDPNATSIPEAPKPQSDTYVDGGITISRTEEVTDQKCPSCGGTVVYDPASLKMVCEFCGYSRELPPPEAGKGIEELDFETAQNRSNCDWGVSVKTVVCKQCGGETVYDALETASTCPFCGSTSVMPVEGVENVMAPGGVVPFEISNEKAAQMFSSWIKGKLFAPNAAKKSCQAKDLHGIYLPYWTYDAQTTSTYKAKYGIEYKDGDDYKVRWYPTSGIYEEFIDDELVYASTKTTNPYIKSVSNFDFKKLRPYTPEIVAGFAAERYSVGLDNGWEKAKESIKPKLNTHIRTKIIKENRADKVSDLVFSTAYANITFKYLLAPIWLATYQFNGQSYNIVINGQTGKVAGKAPVSGWKVLIAILIAIAAIILCYILFGGQS